MSFRDGFVSAVHALTRSDLCSFRDREGADETSDGTEENKVVALLLTLLVDWGANADTRPTNGAMAMVTDISSRIFYVVIDMLS